MFSFARHLDAFKVCPFGEGRFFTSAKVTDVRLYFNKAQMFNTAQYDDQHRRLASLYMPGFNLTEIAGGPIKVVGVVNKTACVEDLEAMASRRDEFARYFFLHVITEAINNLPDTTRTRRNNLTLQTAHCKVLPDYFRVYKEDLNALSSSITTALSNLPEDAPYRFYFTFVKFGQQLRIPHPFTIDSVHLSSIVNKPHRIQSCSMHIATTFSHTSDHFSTFWYLHKHTEMFAGQDVKKYPLFGLSEIGNVTVKNPTSSALLTPWPSTIRENVHLTYVQYYTPFTKSFSSKPFVDHPFLLTLMLGKDHVARNQSFKRFFMSTEKDSDYLALKESIYLHLSKACSRCELVVTCQDVGELLRVNLDELARVIRRASLLVQVSNNPSIEWHELLLHFAGPKE